MTHVCHLCEEEIQDGDIVSCVVYTPYKKLGSKIAFALNARNMVVDPTTLAHKDCKGHANGF